MVLPVHKGGGPLLRFVEAGEATLRIFRAILGRFEERFGIGVVVADAGSRVRGLDAPPDMPALAVHLLAWCEGDNGYCLVAVEKSNMFSQDEA